MTASKCLNLRKDVVQRLYTQGHGIGVIDNPGIRGILSDGFCKFYIYRNGAEGSYHTSRPSRITHGLADSKTLRHMNIHRHLVKGSGKNGDNNKICSCQGLFHAHAGPVCPFTHCLFSPGQVVSNSLIGLRGLCINIVQPYGSPHPRLHGQVCHKSSGPSPGTASYVCNLHVPYHIIFINHFKYRPFFHVFSLYAFFFSILFYTGHYK